MAIFISAFLGSFLGVLAACTVAYIISSRQSKRVENINKMLTEDMQTMKSDPNYRNAVEQLSGW